VSNSAGPAPPPSPLKHPPVLAYLLFTETWERFSFYGMRALLVLYLTKAFLFEDKAAYAIYGSYTALVYATPVLGGLLADRLLGYRKAVLIGGVLMALGHFAMAVPHVQVFYAALALLICGNGFFKPNISSLVGRLYGADDPRRDSAFTVFYMGINLGAFLAPIACGYFGERWGWHWGFALAGVGMLLGLLVFLRAQPLLLGLAEPPARAGRRTAFAGLSLEVWVYLARCWPSWWPGSWSNATRWSARCCSCSGCRCSSRCAYTWFAYRKRSRATGWAWLYC